MRIQYTLFSLGLLICSITIPLGVKAAGDDANQNNSQENDKQTMNVTVHIIDNWLKPSVVYVTRGSTITWINHDRIEHSLVTDKQYSSENWSSNLISSGGNYSRSFENLGEIGYHSTVHPELRGRVVVVESVSEDIRKQQEAVYEQYIQRKNGWYVEPRHYYQQYYYDENGNCTPTPKQQRYYNDYQKQTNYTPTPTTIPVPRSELKGGNYYETQRKDYKTYQNMVYVRIQDCPEIVRQWFNNNYNEAKTRVMMIWEE